MRILTCVIVLFVSAWVTGGSHIPQPTSSISNVEFVTTNTTVFKVVIDESSASTNGALIVGARNEILRFNASSLKLVDHWTNGPLNDSANCQPSAEACSDRRMRANDNHVVLLLPIAPFPTIVSCGTVQQGMCLIHQYKNLSRAGWIGNPTVITNYVSSKRHTIALPIRTNSDATSLSFVIGHEFDDRPDEFSPPSLSIRRMNYHPEPSFAYSRDASVNSTIAIRPQLKKSFRIKYIFGFSDNDYFYIISNQNVDGDSSHAQISRVCLNDTTMTTYTQMGLRCDPQDNLQFASGLNFAAAAYYGDAAPHLRNQLNATKASKVLYIAFVDPSNRTSQSVLCATSMDQLNDQLNGITSDCMEGGERATMHPAFDNSNANPPNQNKCSLTRWTTNNFCKPRSSNFYILSRESSRALPLVHFAEQQITSLTTYVVKNATIALIGDHNGQVMKHTLDSQPRLLFHRSFSSSSTADDDKQVRSEPAIDSAEQFAYLAVENRIVKFPLKSCSIYTKCSECFLARDPLGCGWCGDRCSTARECSIALSNTCPPIVHDFTPKSGPTNGGTEITILGDNFGYSQSNGSIEVDAIDDESFSECLVKSQENDKIVCVTQSASPMTGRLKVKIAEQKHLTLNYTIGGAGESAAHYTFVNFSVTGKIPSFGPKSGGTVFKIFGTNLTIGLNRSVYIVDNGSRIMAECEMNQLAANEINCTMGNMTESAESQGYLMVIIDGQRVKTNIRHTFKENPEVVEISPQVSTLTAQLNITVRGHNLDSVAAPVLLVEGKSNLSVPCHTVDSFLINCQLPKLNDSWKNTAAQVAITNDGEKISSVDTLPRSPLFIYPDPWFSASLNPVSVDDMRLNIHGENIHVPHAVKITLGPDESPCEVRTSDTYRLSCEINLGRTPSLNESLIVNYKFGVTGGTLGYVKFMQRSDSAINTWITISLGVILASLVILLICLRRTRESKSDYGAVSYMAVECAQNSPVANDYCSTARRNANHVQLAPHIEGEFNDLVSQLSAGNKFIAREYLVLGGKIGKGHFGEVFTGVLELPDGGKRQVAVKTLQNYSPSVVNTFLKEATVMSDFKHPNVLPLIGVSFSESQNIPSLVFPFMSNKDLLQYVREDTYVPTVRQLLTFTLDIARGMDYLSAQKVVHRDLAARNCMLDGNLTVHVADFGLSRDVYEQGYYKSGNAGPLPYKWMAVESLERMKFTSKSDVWSYGITSWEVITRGLVPYIGVDNSDLFAWLCSGQRLPQPQFCPEHIYNMWQQCWLTNSEERPSFSQIVQQIEDFLNQASKKALEKNVPTDANYVNVGNGRYYNHSVDTA